MDEEGFESSEMAKSGSFTCLSKQTITTALECLLSCIITIGTIYVFLLILGLIQVTKVDNLLMTIGYISLIIAISAPIGLYGTEKSRYWALFLYYILASYHLYALIMYIWFNIKESVLASSTSSSSSSASLSTYQNEDTKPITHKTLLEELSLHQVTTGAYTMLVFFSLIFVVFKIISTTNQIEPAKVIVVDNNPLD